MRYDSLGTARPTGNLASVGRILSPGLETRLAKRPMSERHLPPDELFFDWTRYGRHTFDAPTGRITVNDETLRDGLQSPSVIDPPIEAKVRIVHLMEALGIEHASFGIPASGPRPRETATRLCQEVDAQRLSLRPNLGGRTVAADAEAIVEVAQQTGLAIEACLFLGSSPIRQYAEAWNLDEMVRLTRSSVGRAAREGLAVTYITEDTVRSSPEHLRTLITAAVEAGATRVCLCDTVGSALPAATRNLVEWVRSLLDEIGPDVGIDWHGHRDRGLGLANTLAAMESGATRLHGTALGVGERVGNASTEEILVNLRLLGLRDHDLGRLGEYVEAVAEALGLEVPSMHPLVGRDAFRTATGVHAAAVMKARDRGADWLADRIYSGVPASWLGRRQEIEIGPLSGSSNVAWFLRARGLPEDPVVIDAVLASAKASRRVLTEAEVTAAIESCGRDARPGTGSEPGSHSDTDSMPEAER
jgi:2-isopropylmalate synthase